MNNYGNNFHFKNPNKKLYKRQVIKFDGLKFNNFSKYELSYENSTIKNISQWSAAFQGLHQRQRVRMAEAGAGGQALGGAGNPAVQVFE